MAAEHLYVDVAAARIQHYLGRTPRLKGQRGASARLSWATDARPPNEQRDRHLAEQIKALGAEPNPEAGQADGLVSMRLAASADARAAAEAVAGYLRELLPAADLTAVWGTGASYLEAYRDQMKPQRDDPPLTHVPALADFPALASCAECRAAPAVDKIDIHELPASQYAWTAAPGTRTATAGQPWPRSPTRAYPAWPASCRSIARKRS